MVLGMRPAASALCYEIAVVVSSLTEAVGEMSV